MTLAEVLAAQAAGAAVVDTRGPEDFALGHLAGSINIGMSGRYAEFAGGVIAPETLIVLITEEGRELEAKNRLARIGFDSVLGALTSPMEALVNNPEVARRSSRVDVAGLVDAMATIADLQVVDVRQPGETEGGHIEGAILIPLTKLNAASHTLDRTKPTIVYCAGGFRSSIAASQMLANGFEDVSDLLGGYGAWDDAHASAS